MFSFITDPLFLGLAGAVYILFIHKPKGEDDATKPAPKTDTTADPIGGIVGVVEAKILEKAQQAAAGAGLDIVAKALGAVARGDSIALANVAETLAENLPTTAGRKYLLGRAFNSFVSDLAANDPAEFAKLSGEMNNKKKDIADAATRMSTNSDLQSQ